MRQLALSALVGVSVFASCRKEAPLPQLPQVKTTVELDANGPWQTKRQGPAWVFEQDGLHVHVIQPSSPNQEVTGVTLGVGRGPLTGLLQGQFAPLVLLPRAQLTSASSAQQNLILVFDSGTRLRIRRGSGRVLMTVVGPLQLALPASNTPVRGLKDKAPVFSGEVTAGERPRVSTHVVDELYVDSSKWGTVKLQPACGRVSVVRAIPRGSTSVFVLEAGGPTVANSWRPTTPKAEALAPACPSTQGSTLSVSWPLPD